MAILTTEDIEVIRCSTNGKFIAPCTALSRVLVQGGIHTKLGIIFQTYSSMKTGKPTRNLVILRSGEFAEGGIIANFCPLCGEPLGTEA